MHEPLTLELTVEVLRDLHAAFPSKMDDLALRRRAEVYRNNLNGVSGSALRWAAKRAIHEDSFFPKIARLRGLSSAWAQHNAPAERLAETQNRACRCGEPYAAQKRYRPKHENGGWGPIVVSEDGHWLMLEQYARDLCAKCAAPCRYWPELDAPGKEPAMRLFTVAGAPNVPVLTLASALAAKKSPKRVPEPLKPGAAA